MKNKIGMMNFLERTVDYTRTDYVTNRLNKFYSKWWKVMVASSVVVIVAKMVTEFIVLIPY